MAATAKRYCRMVDVVPTMVTLVAVTKKAITTPKTKLSMMLAKRLGMTKVLRAWLGVELTVEYTNVMALTTKARI